MKLKETEFEGLFIIELNVINDFRGSFKKVYNEEFLDMNNLNSSFVDLNHSTSVNRGVLRGFHYQTPPFEEVKYVKCIKGRIIDYAIDMRKESPTYLKTFSHELDENDNRAIYIPNFFAHGYMALEDGSEVIYLSSNKYSPTHEKQINPNDPSLNIDYPLIPILSEKDSNSKFLEI